MAVVGNAASIAQTCNELHALGVPMAALAPLLAYANDNVCPICGRMEARDSDWETFDKGEADHLCWGLGANCSQEYEGLETFAVLGAVPLTTAFQPSSPGSASRGLPPETGSSESEQA